LLKLSLAVDDWTRQECLRENFHGGIEYKWGHWVARGEYRFSEFQSTNINFFQPDGRLAQGIHARLRPESQIAYFGLSYLFYSEAAAPVRASY